PAAADSPAKPTPRTRAASPASVMSTPSARSAAAVDRLSPPRPRPLASTTPSASAPNRSSGGEIDLQPATRRLTRSGPDLRTVNVSALINASLPHQPLPARLRDRLTNCEEFLGHALRPCV